jgi:hypothetical protein
LDIWQVPLISVVLGILLMHVYWLDCFAVGIQILSGLVQGGYYYYPGGKKFKLNRVLYSFSV